MRAFKTVFTTFYSYKGGVGRTSALVNSALLRAMEGDRVVVIDFDLEAPGVSSYVEELVSQQGKNLGLDNRPGILEYLYETVHSDKVTELKNKAITKNDLGLNLEGNIWFIGAGNTSTSKYTKKLNSLNWDEIFKKKHGALLLENFKRQIIKEFNNPDYVFIDSRTGITEIGGVCTGYLSDLVVVLSSLNKQNLVGTSKVLNSFKKSKIPTLFVASNIPIGLPWGKAQLFYQRIQDFKKSLGKEPDVFIYHYSSLSLKEYLPSYFKLQDKKSVFKEDPLLKSYENLSERIDSSNVHSFQNFFEEIIRSLFKSTAKAGNNTKVEDDFKFFETYYYHRVTLLKSLKSIRFIIHTLHQSKSSIINKDTIEAMNTIRKSESLSFKKFPHLHILKRMTIELISNKISTEFKENYKDFKDDLYWFSVLPSNNQMLVVEILANHGNYKAIFDNTPSDETNKFLLFARGVAAENLGLKDESNRGFKRFAKHVVDDPSGINVASVAFAYSYALAKMGDIPAAIESLEKAESVTKEDDQPLFMFIPTKLKITDRKDEFLKALNSFKETLI